MTHLFLPSLRSAHKKMREYAEDFDDEFYLGVCWWNRCNREMWQDIKISRSYRDMAGRCETDTIADRKCGAGVRSISRACVDDIDTYDGDAPYV